MRALVTGAAHGLGRALAQELLEAGHDVVAMDVDVAPLDELAMQSRGACKAVRADMADPTSLAAALDTIRGETFDLVILNAGINATGPFEDIPLTAYERLIAVNLTAPLQIASFLMAEGTMARGGRIVFVSSLSHAVGYPGASVYAATKTGLATYARSVRKPFRKKGVRVLTVFPGPIRTDHAARHAPPGAKADRRMPPRKLARMILKAARSRASDFYPGTAAGFAKLAGSLAPFLTTRMMRRALFDKLDGPTF